MIGKEVMERRVSQLDVARAAGVSVSTVSRALSDAPGISGDLRQQIHQLARALGYSLRVERQAMPPAIAYLTLNSATGGMGPFYEGITEALVREALSVGMHVETAMVESSAFGLERLRSDAGRVGAGAVFLIGVDPPEAVRQALKETAMPVVFVNGLDLAMRFDSVTPANLLGGGLAVRVLHEAGHKSILYVTGQHRATTLQRLLGIRQTAEQLGIALSICEVERVDHEQIIAALSRQFAGDHPPWTAIACMNDLAALSVKQFLETHGMRIPEDISLLGFDDLPYARMVHPRLSTIRVDRVEVGVQAVRLMQRRLANPEALPLQIEVGLEPAAGATLGPPRPARGRRAAATN